MTLSFARWLALTLLSLSLAACAGLLRPIEGPDVECGTIPEDVCLPVVDLALATGGNAPLPPITKLAIADVECQEGRGARRIAADLADDAQCWALVASVTDGRSFGMVYERLDGSLGVVWE